MTNHPNRGRGTPGRNPSPIEVRERRERFQRAADVGVTTAQAWCAAQVHTSRRVWQQWETEAGTVSHRSMHPAFWELFQLKTPELTITRGDPTAERHETPTPWDPPTPPPTIASDDTLTLFATIVPAPR